MEDSGISVRSVSRRYGDKVALDDLTLNVPRGEICGFVGPNGAGKTTAMRIMVGLLAADRGSVLWDGEPIGDTRRRRIGYMPEERGLYPKMRIGDQLAYLGELHGLSPSQAEQRAGEWLERLGLADRLEDNVEVLSLGNQQRVQLAASLVFDPDLLILDEPFSGLDPVGVDLLSDVIREFCEERDVPVIFSSHQLELVERICDSVAIIKDGTLIASGLVSDLEAERAGNVWLLRLADRDDWRPGLDGVTRLEPGTFELEPDLDPQELLRAGQAVGEVIEFRRRVPGLSELFRETIGEER
ncbi:MAG: ATP-binding cassette domain-containing protein [Solirubrobacterales bacterium]|nr:ATP-binding cassette domain-containing protein [Solirubrobacterales bacterium]